MNRRNAWKATSLGICVLGFAFVIFTFGRLPDEESFAQEAQTALDSHAKDLFSEEYVKMHEELLVTRTELHWRWSPFDEMFNAPAFPLKEDRHVLYICEGHAYFEDDSMLIFFYDILSAEWHFSGVARRFPANAPMYDSSRVDGSSDGSSGDGSSGDTGDGSSREFGSREFREFREFPGVPGHNT